MDLNPTLTPYQRTILELLEDGALIDDDGLLVPKFIMPATGHVRAQAASGVLKSMDDQGMIVREVRGRRTWLVAITALGRRLLAEDRAERKRRDLARSSREDDLRRAREREAIRRKVVVLEAELEDLKRRLSA